MHLAREHAARSRIAFAGTGIPVHQDARLRECDYGTLNGAPVANVAAERRRRIQQAFPGGGESYLDVVSRTRDFLADLLHDRDDQRVVVISHSANRWALDAIVNGRDLVELVDAPFRWQPGWDFLIEPHHVGA